MRNKRIIIKRNNNTTHTITVQSTSGTIDGAASVTMTTAWQIKELYSDGVGWVELLGGTAGSAGTITEAFVGPISDQTTALTTGTKMTWRMPYAFTITDIRASVNTAQTSGDALRFDVKDGGTSLMSKAVLRALDHAVDAFVVTDLDGRLIASGCGRMRLAHQGAHFGAQLLGRRLERV
jgi:hypothetical protein